MASCKLNLHAWLSSYLGAACGVAYQVKVVLYKIVLKRSSLKATIAQLLDEVMVQKLVPNSSHIVSSEQVLQKPAPARISWSMSVNACRNRLTVQRASIVRCGND